MKENTLNNKGEVKHTQGEWILDSKAAGHVKQKDTGRGICNTMGVYNKHR